MMTTAAFAPGHRGAPSPSMLAAGQTAASYQTLKAACRLYIHVLIIRCAPTVVQM